MPILAIITLAFASFANALPGNKVDNFVLLDHRGDAHELHYYRQSKAVVLMVHGNGCQIVRSNLEEFQQLRDSYAAQGVEFMMINSNAQDNRQSIAEEAAEWGIDLPVLEDEGQIIGKAMGLVRTGEVLVIDTKNWQIAYRGALSDRVDFERQKNQASKRYVKNALDAVLAGTPVQLTQVTSPGCLINYPEPSEISYADTIVPILQENCMACHVKSGIAPWAMTEYALVKGFAPMMREVLRTKRMPPWHTDPEIGHWQNNKSISIDDKRTLINWIEAGAPRGDGDDPLKKTPTLENSWALGEPDLIIDIPEFEVPANGVVDYQFPVVKNPLDRDVWVIAAAIIPGDPKAVHHILAGSSQREVLDEEVSDIFENFILTYAPGNESSFMPEGTGVFVPKGGVYQFQMHYTPYGKKSVDRSRIGLYFADAAPENFLREHVLVNTDIRIPANAERHEEHAYFDFWEDAIIYALFPHSHYRGRSSTFELVYPDGNKETLLSVPNYDFNWQRTYSLLEPKEVPAGTRMIHRTIYDNSSKNRGNPDPSSDITWGLQSEEEMLYGSMSFSWAKETTSAPIHRPGLTRISQIMGSWDRDIDGRVTQAELPDDVSPRARDNLLKFDKDADGGLNMAEFAEFMKRMRES
ncbi:MAG: redoxin domain-containing protein [Pseudomonadota bacterium]